MDRNIYIDIYAIIGKNMYRLDWMYNGSKFSARIFWMIGFYAVVYELSTFNFLHFVSKLQMMVICIKMRLFLIYLIQAYHKKYSKWQEDEHNKYHSYPNIGE